MYEHGSLVLNVMPVQKIMYCAYKTLESNNVIYILLLGTRTLFFEIFNCCAHTCASQLGRIILRHIDSLKVRSFISSTSKVDFTLSLYLKTHFLQLNPHPSQCYLIHGLLCYVVRVWVQVHATVTSVVTVRWDRLSGNAVSGCVHPIYHLCFTNMPYSTSESQIF